ncbi:MAG: tetratricopeptide repeat protein [Candidatus Hermodarchaeota archaeon]
MARKELDFEKKLEKARHLNLSSPPEAEKVLRKLLTHDLVELDKVKTQIELGRSLSTQGKHENAQEYYKLAYNQAHEQGFKEQEADALEGLATIDHDLGEIEQGLKRGYQALKMFQELKIKEKETQASNTIARLYYTRGDLQNALKWFETTLRLSKETQNDLNVLRAFNNIANVYNSRGVFEKAAEYFSESVDMAEKLKYGNAICITRHNLAEVQAIMGDYAEARKNYEQALQFAKSTKDKRNSALLSSSLADLLVELGELKKASRLFKTAFKIQEELGEPARRIVVRNQLAHFWLVKGQFQEAKKLLEESLQISEETGIIEFYFDTLIRLVEATEQLDEAYNYLKLADKLSRERKSEVEHARVLVQRGRINVNKLQFDEAEMLLNEGRWLAQKLNHINLQFQAEMLIAQNSLARYQQDPTQNQYYEQAVAHITEAMELAKEKKLIPNYIKALIVRGTLYSLQGETVKAKQSLSEAIRLANKREMTFQARSVKEQILLVSSQQYEQLARDSAGQLKKIFMDLAMEELKRYTATYVESTITEKDLAQTFLISFKVGEGGPTIHEGENIDLSDPVLMGEMMHIGTLYAMSLGQGQEYHEGLFGPLPFGRSDLRAVIYTRLLSDPSQTEKRSHGMSYMLFCFVFLQKMVPFFYDQQKLEQLFAMETSKLNDVTDIKQEFLTNLRKKIFSEFTADLTREKETD